MRVPFRRADAEDVASFLSPKGDTNVTEAGAAALVGRFVLIYRRGLMKGSFWVLAVLVGTLLAPACDDDARPPGQAGSDSPFVGGTCGEATECEFLLCQNGPETPGGMCTLSCGTSQNCSAGSSCVRTSSGWLCFVDCTSDADCRTDQYRCQPVAEAPAPTQQSCTQTSDCPSGVCRQGQCNCTNDADCEAGSLCVGGGCSRGIPVCIGVTSQ